MKDNIKYEGRFKMVNDEDFVYYGFYQFRIILYENSSTLTLSFVNEVKGYENSKLDMIIYEDIHDLLKIGQTLFPF